MATLALDHHPRLRKMHRALGDTVHRLVVKGYDVARHTPMPRGVRDGLRERVAWQSRLEVVSVHQLLLGGQNRMSAEEWARRTGDLLWPSRRVADGPHAELLERAADGMASDEDILSSPYADMARQSIALSGQYFSATDDAGILEVARDYLASVRGTAPSTRKPHQTRLGLPIEVAPVRDSACYQVVDGHHRVAALVANGIDRVAVRVNRMSVRTPLQELLGSMSWIGGEPELYQPVDAPEVATWPTVRGCWDRKAAMLGLLESRGHFDRPAGPGSYLDVASCYGWFVAAMQQHGFAAQGVERDPKAPELAMVLHGLTRDQVATSDAMEFLGAAPQQWDVVSCFSLLHHFVLGRGSATASELVKALDRSTRSVLFLDTGQEHETWFRESLAGWDAERVRRFLAKETSFDRIIDLGPDQDDRPPYSGNYGRHLFACVREP